MKVEQKQSHFLFPLDKNHDFLILPPSTHTHTHMHMHIHIPSGLSDTVCWNVHLGEDFYLGPSCYKTFQNFS